MCVLWIYTTSTEDSFSDEARLNICLLPFVKWPLKNWIKMNEWLLSMLVRKACGLIKEPIYRILSKCVRELSSLR
jgi:hypothetical protein